MLDRMPLTVPQRIDMIRQISTLLGMQEWGEIDLVLEQHGFPTTEEWHDSRQDYCLQMVKNASDDSLKALHGYLTADGDPGARPGGGPWSGEKLRLFCSHLSAQKKLVHGVADQLILFGIEPFVAHDSIEPSTEWQTVIEGALSDCDAMLVFLHEGFRESNWCDQEVGWTLGRQRPLLALNYGTHPHGFIGKFQAQQCDGQSVHTVADYVLDWLGKTPSLHGRFAHGLVDAFVGSPSWDFTRRVAPRLQEIASVDNDDLTRMEHAAVSNVDVRECNISGVMGPEWVKRFVAERRGPSGGPFDDLPF